MVINNIFVTNATKMTLSDRFTILQSVRPVIAPQRQRRIPAQDAEYRNRRLLERLALKPIAEAASTLRKVPVKQRIGVINRINPQRRSNLWNLNRKNQNARRSLLLRRTNTFTNVRQTRQLRKRRLPRSNSFGNLSRSNSVGNLFQGNLQNRNFMQGRRQPRQGNNVSQNINFQSNNNFVRGRSMRRRGLVRGQTGNPNSNETNFNITTVNRGRGRNLRRGINRSWFAQKTPPTKDELDKQLDQYMAGTRSHLDKELDSYMNSAMDIDGSII